MSDATAERNAAIAYLAMIGAQISSTIGAASAKGLFVIAGPAGLAALRTSIAALLLLALTRAWRTPISGRQLRVLILYGFIMGSMNLLIYEAFARIPIGLAVTIEMAGPLAVVLITSRSVVQLLWFCIAVCSLLMLMPWQALDHPLDPFGVVFSLAAAVCWALYIHVGKSASEVRTGTAVTIGLIAACFVTMPFGLWTAGTELFGRSVLAAGLVVAILSSMVPYALEMKALERLGRRAFGILLSGYPAAAALGGFLILGERLTLLQWVAVAIMILACVGSSFAGSPPVARVRDDAMA
ncbi:MAG: DMT family transporter [Sphingobium sp.]